MTAGWTPDRRIATDSIEQIVRDKGFNWHENAARFYERFGNLLIRTDERHTFDTQPDQVDDLIAPEQVTDYQVVLRSGTLAPIGVSDAWWSIFVDTEGRFYAALDESYGCCGNNPSELFEHLVGGRPFATTEYHFEWTKPGRLNG